MSPDRDKDVQKGSIVVEISVENGPISGIVASSDGSRLIVTNYGGDSVSIIDTDSGRVVETVSGVQEPFAIAAGGPESLAPNRVYVSSVSRAYDAIEVIDVSTNTVVATDPLALSVSDLVVSADGRYVYASRNGTGGTDVAILDTTTGRIEVIDIAGPGTITQRRAPACNGPPVRRHQRARRREARRARCIVRRSFFGTRTLAPEKAHPLSHHRLERLDCHGCR